MTADGLFIYGTLREGGRHRTWLERTHPEGVTAGEVRGRLFHLPNEGYPALVAGTGEAWVLGEFVGYGDAAELEAALADLDQLEEVDAGLFERRILPVRLAGGREYLAWVYVFPEDRLPRLEKEAVEVPDGDWAPWLG